VLGGALTGCWLTVAAATADYEAHLRATTRARTATGAEALQARVAGDVELQPTLRVHAEEQNLEAWLSYSPRLTLRQPLADSRTQLLHAGRLQGEWRVQRGLRLTAEEYATYGTVDLFNQLLETPVPGTGGQTPPADVPLEPVPQGAVRFASSLTTLGWETTSLAPRLRLWGTLGYALGGGLDDVARLSVPFQHGPRLRVDARYSLTRLDGLTTTATATDSRFSTGARATVVQLDETWAHRFSRATEGELGLGVGLAWARPADGSDAAHLQGSVLPGARASVAHRLLSREYPLEARLTTRLAPFIDRLTGGVYPRAEATLLLTWTAAPGVWVYGQGGAARVLGGGEQGGDSLAQGALGARWELRRGVSLEADVRGNTQRQAGLQRAEPFQWAATLGLAVSHTGMF
jgi:hypothetical protein